ncbi:membrane protein insertion efficiency factor YidD [Kaarinaea lacus]
MLRQWLCIGKNLQFEHLTILVIGGYILRRLCLIFIALYQRFISPYKGFRCAHAAYYSGPSCSSAIKTIIAEYGLLQSKPQIQARFAQCRHAYTLILAEQNDEQGGNKKIRRIKRKRKDKDQSDWCFSDYWFCPCDLAALIPRSCGRRGGKDFDGDTSCDINPCDSGPCDCSP